MMHAPHPDRQPAGRAIEASVARAWYIVLLLTALLMASYIDRFMLTVLAAPMSVDLGVSDRQVGVLMGLGFSLCYALVGVPMAWLLDKGTRIRIVVAAALLWSCASLASGFATGFDGLIACRALIAIGEAALTPAAVSLIPDLFPENRRALPTSIYFSISVAGTTLTYLIGGAALALATTLQPLLHWVPWRGALILGALPGLAFAALLWLTVREPVRRIDRAILASADTPAEGFGHFARRWRFYAAFYFGMFAVTTAPLAVHAWLPTALTRSYDYKLTDAAYALGLAGTIGGVLGAFGWPALVGKFEQRGRNMVKLAAMVVASLAGGAAALLFLAIDVRISIAAFGVLFLFFGAHAPLGAMVLQSVVPARLRARAMAINNLVVILGALSIAPLLVPAASGAFFADAPDAMLRSMAIVAPAMALLAGIAFAAALVLVRRAQARTNDLP